MEEDSYSKNRYAFDRPNEAPRYIDHDFKEYLVSFILFFPFFFFFTYNNTNHIQNDYH
jgi:hypothetical protein